MAWMARGDSGLVRLKLIRDTGMVETVGFLKIASQANAREAMKLYKRRYPIY